LARRMPWKRFKEDLPERLLRERDIGYLDPGIEPMLERINSVPGLATTSTCIGRVTIVEGEWPWERGEEAARIVYKTHTRLTLERLMAALSLGYCNLWLRVSPPLLHVRAASEECALHLLELARRTGHKHSGIISLAGEAGIVVEIMSGAQFTLPLTARCARTVTLSAPSLERLVSLVNETLEENRRRLSSLAESVSRDPGPCEWTGPESTP